MIEDLVTGPFFRSIVMWIGRCQLDSPLCEFEGNLTRVVAGMERAGRDLLKL